MFNIFLTNQYLYNYPVKKYTKFLQIQRRYLHQLRIIKEYWRNRERAVNNNHILHRLITSIAPSTELDVFDYLNFVTANAKLISKEFNIVSNIHSGKVMRNLFFGKKSSEILLYREDPIDIEYFEKNWRDVAAIKVIYTDETDLDFNIPFNDKEYSLPTLHVMTIDIIGLMLQYRYWVRERLAIDMSTNSSVFVAMVVLPNMVDNMLDLALYNRYIAISKNEAIPDFKFKHPFNVLNYSKKIDAILTKVVKDTENMNIPLEQILLSVPTMVEENMIKVLHIDHKYYTVQSEWVLWLSRIKTLTDIVSLFGIRGLKRNRDLINSIYYKYKQFKRSNVVVNKINNLPNVKADYEIALDTLSEYTKE